MKKVLYTTVGLIICLLSYAPHTQARDASAITDWYIKDFQSEIVLNKDSSLDITETIVADCGNLPDKHGIFRMLPTHYQKTANQQVKTPIKLISITDASGSPIKYSATNEADSVTWKIGDPNKTVTGLNTYILHYLVKNTIRFDNSNFDELYWNLNGNFWQIETDHFVGTIKFPNEISQDNAQISVYSGAIGVNTNLLSSYSWLDTNTLQFTSNKMLESGEGITASVTFPKNIILPYTPTFWEKYGQSLFLLLPIFIFWLCLRIWRRFGKDFKLKRTIIAEYEIPDNLSPIELSTLQDNGSLKVNAVTAAIINLAVNGYLKIEQLEKSGLFGKKNYKLIRLEGAKSISEVDKNLLAYLFGGSTEIEIKDLTNKFYSNIPRLKDEANKYLIQSDYIDASGFKWQIAFIVLGILTIVGGFFSISTFLVLLVLSLILSGIIFLIFATLMPKRTMKGAETYLRILGFKLFINKTEKYRANFNERENIFEKFLPYAILFGLTGIWIKNMKSIYGEAYFNSYHPIWFYGAMYTTFNADSLDNLFSDLSNQMNSVIASN
ncbi:MAG: DUF2207 domain-containing protein, partial [bacterium]